MSFTAYLDSGCDCECDCECGSGPVETSGENAGTDKLLRPPISGASTVYWGCLPPGRYKVLFCGGVWEYFNPTHADDWVITRTPVNCYSTWTGNIQAGYWFDIVYMSAGSVAYTHFTEPQPDGWGYASSADALAVAANIPPVIITHSGGPIGIHFSDLLYTDNVGTVTPTFRLCTGSGGLVNSIVAGTNCGRIVSGRYEHDFYVTSLCHHTGVSATLQTGLNISNPTTATGIELLPGVSTKITITFDLNDETVKCFDATLNLSGGGTDGVSLEYDMTPNIQVDTAVAYYEPGVCADAPQYVNMTMSLVSGLPCKNSAGATDLTATIGTSSTVTRTQACTEGALVVDAGPVCGGGPGDGSFAFRMNPISTPPHPATWNTIVNWGIGLCSLPPTTTEIALSWT